MKYKNKYRSTSTRLKHWDYSDNGWYFITICTQNKEHFFGEVIDGEMVLSQIGKIADKFWKEIPNHFKNVILDNHVIMPNHTHGIIIINNQPVETPYTGVYPNTRPHFCNVSNLSGIKPSQNIVAPRQQTPKLGVSTQT